jgi:NADH-quinone oxidoreductase subunit D
VSTSRHDLPGAAYDPAGDISESFRDPATGDFRQETMIINMGPQHPSTHGCSGCSWSSTAETVIRCKPVIGYLHTGIEKNTEYRSWVQGVTYVTRADYVAPFSNELAYCMRSSGCSGSRCRARAGDPGLVVRAEPDHVAPVALATGGLELGASSVMLYGLREREVIMDIFEAITGLRMNHAYIRPAAS